MTDGTPRRASLLTLGIVAIAAGIAVGFTGGAFRWLLVQASYVRESLSAWAHAVPFGWLALMALGAAAAALAALLVLRSPRAAGSGIQDAEAVYRGELDLPPLGVIPVRFAGGLLSIGSGMVLGREGPTVHIGATLGVGAGRVARFDDDDLRTLQTAMSGAGLAVAFNAPVGGSVFVLEEIAKSASMRLVVPTLLGVGTAIACSRVVLGDQPDFAVASIPNPPMSTLPLFAMLGILLGLAGALYNTLTVGLVRTQSRMSAVPAPIRAGVVGAVIGLALAIDPRLVGGGDELAQTLLAGQALAVPLLLLFFVVRFVIGPLSYSAGTPGGLFAPMLALGTLAGTLFAHLVQVFDPRLGDDFVIAMAVVGMSTLFAAVVRAPITGIALIIEMTALTTLTVAMLIATGAAVVTAMIVKSPPVYDTLRAILLGTDGTPAATPKPPAHRPDGM